jgi:hypothetical protein
MLRRTNQSAKVENTVAADAIASGFVALVALVYRARLHEHDWLP